MRDAAAVVLVALALAACGPTPPQAPLPYAKKLDSATSGLSTACGEAYQVRAFPGQNRSSLDTLEATAASSVRKLAGVYDRDPAWIYQGETVRDIVADSYSMLSACGLEIARDLLRHATSPH